jgi:putative phage-type endonuclease
MPQLKRNIRNRRNIKRKQKMITRNRIEILNKLKEQPLIKQRTEEWFKLRENRLTASDLYDAVHYPSTLIKKKLKNVSFNSYSIPALRWGCMFESIACDIYALNNLTKVNEFGLLINDNIKDFGASPDGITDEGIMIEIKCPYSREIKKQVIPDKYYYQMQGQMAVCELDVCDYIECKFITFENEEEYIDEVKDIENYKHGVIIDYKNGSYKYSTFNNTYENNINEMNELNVNNDKIIYWMLEMINVQRVKFDNKLWDSKIRGKIEEYTKLYQKEKLNNEKTKLFIEDSD